MIDKEKQLLLTDLCARLPYGVIIQEYNEEYGYCDNALNTIGIGYFSIHEACIEGTWINRIENVRPYLRPMSSMTEEEITEYWRIEGIELDYADKRYPIKGDRHITWQTQDYLVSRHLDYRGLIEKGLAIEAPDGMYNK